MKMLKKLVLGVIVFAGISLVSNNAQAQFAPGAGFKQVNVGLEAGTLGVYAGMDFGISEMITIGPRVSFLVDPGFGFYNATYSVVLPSFRLDYHYSGHIDPLPDQLDLYGGVSTGVGFESIRYEDPALNDYTNVSFEAWVQAGARWYFNDSFGAHVEFKGGTFTGTSFGSVGVSFKF